MLFAIAPGNPDLQKHLGADVQAQWITVKPHLLSEHQIVMSPFSFRVFKNSATARLVAEKFGLSQGRSVEGDFADLLAELRDRHTVLGQYAAWLTAIQKAHPDRLGYRPATDEQIGATAEKLAQDFFTFLKKGPKNRPRKIVIRNTDNEVSRPQSFEGELAEADAGEMVLRYTSPNSEIPLMDAEQVGEYFELTEEHGIELKETLEHFIEASARNEMIPIETFREVIDGLTQLSIDIVTCAANASGSPLEGEIREFLEYFLESELKIRGGQLPFKDQREVSEIKRKVVKTAEAIRVLFTISGLEKFPTDRDFWEELIYPVVE